MEQEEHLPFIDEHEEEQRKAAAVYRLTRPIPAHGARLFYEDPPRWYHQGALGASIARRWRRTMSSVSELLSTMR